MMKKLSATLQGITALFYSRRAGSVQSTSLCMNENKLSICVRLFTILVAAIRCRPLRYFSFGCINENELSITLQFIPVPSPTLHSRSILYGALRFTPLKMYVHDEELSATFCYGALHCSPIPNAPSHCNTLRFAAVY